jgi:hypothetical protein
MTKPIYLPEPILGKDIKLTVSGARGQEIQRAIENRARILGRVKSYEFKGAASLQQAGRSRFVPPIYDLAEISRAADVEPYITQSVRKHREQILKEGYEIAGTEDELVQYVKQRLFEIAVITGITTEQWLRELVTNLITFHNAFLILRRDSSRSSGKPITVYGKVLDPIAGIFVGDPTTMEVSVDKYGTPKKWRQKIEGLAVEDSTTDKTFAPEDVIHITVDKKTGFTFGTPYLLPVLDDIRALRKLEEVAIIMASKEAFPLYHYKVGTDQKPAIYYEGGSNEVDQVNDQVSSLPAQGYIVTSERHEINLISREGSALDLRPYLEYFESRVIAGLRLSPLDLGRGGSLSRGTATNLNQGLQDSAKDYQQVISDHLTHFIVLPLLLEGAFDITEENIVRWTFPTINREEERASQNHGLQLLMGNGITNSEFRKRYLNKPPMSDEDKNDTCLRQNIEAEKEVIRTQGQFRAAASTSRSSGPDSSNRATSNRISNIGQPRNQYGTKSAKSRFKANDYLDKSIEKFKSIRSLVLEALNDPETDSTHIEEYFRDFVKSAFELSKDKIKEHVEAGYARAKKDYSYLHPDEDIDFEELGSRALDRFFTNYVNKSFWKSLNPYKDQIIAGLKRDSDNNINIVPIVSLLTSAEEAIKTLIADQAVTAERFGFIKFAKKVGSKTIDLVNPDTEDRTELDISELVYKNFIPSSEDANHYPSFSKVKDSTGEQD